jgi:acetyltransferase-like isoleucine patch superfamily enzyme
MQVFSGGVAMNQVVIKVVRDAIHLVGNIVRALRMSLLKASGVKVGNGTMISMGAKIDLRRGRIIIGDNCFITYGAVILSHDRASMHIHPGDPGQGDVLIGDNVFVGVNAVILPGVSIGDNSVIGAGAVVAKDVPSGVVVVGNPSRIVREIDRFKKAKHGSEQKAK